MNLSPPIPWRAVPPGATALLSGVPTLVLDIWHDAARGVTRVRVERSSAATPVIEWWFADNRGSESTTRLVALDDGDALATLDGAGLNPEIIAITVTPPEKGAAP